MNRTQILEAAASAVKERGENYGSPASNFQRIADLWSSYTGHMYTMADVGVMMTLLKIARLKETPSHSDSWVDIAGYAAVTSEAIDDTPSI